ncbi:hypothetical protein PGT21_027557 [Puccinia graminis f. sp. tritici]|uniref:Chromo domain-containing protein n=1 Tax=Puccinia graminis f. sp. tritici TaxID=56615 RepID=A0A5B0M4K7_PUCGR|nr:hypothetical protein PGT21_027557 [Puccinia graminis f. sp. tritici]
MIGKNAVKLDIKKDYPLLHPVFNVSLLVRYEDPMAVNDRGLAYGLKDKYYTDDQVVDWTMVRAILDERSVSKGKVDYLVAWKGATVGENTWIAEKHIPESAKSHVELFKSIYISKYKKKKKKAVQALGQNGVVGGPVL